jgi:IS30 family transposase
MEYRQLAQGERYVMARMIRQGYSYRAIAAVLDRSASTITRERKRNATHHDGHYRAEKAHQYAMARRSRTRKQDQYSQQEWEQVAGLVERKWSPEQIAGRARSMRKRCMSKETIYRYLRRDRCAGGQTWRQLRIVSKFGRKRRGSPATRGRLVGKRHIGERPKAVELRVRIGHWEGDTVMGAYSGPRAPAIPIRTRHHFRFNPATDSDRRPPLRWLVWGPTQVSAGTEREDASRSPSG